MDLVENSNLPGYVVLPEVSDPQVVHRMVEWISSGVLSNTLGTTSGSFPDFELSPPFWCDVAESVAEES